MRRATDEPEEDHWNNGDRETDWRKNTPRSALIVAIYALMGICSALGTYSYHALQKDLNDVRVEVRDQRYQLLGKHEEDIGQLQAQLKQLAEAAEDAKHAREDAARAREEMRLTRQTIDSMNARLARKGI